MKKKIWANVLIGMLAAGLFMGGCGKNKEFGNVSTSSADASSEQMYDRNEYGLGASDEASNGAFNEASNGAFNGASNEAFNEASNGASDDGNEKAEAPVQADMDGSTADDTENRNYGGKLIYTYHYSVETKVFDTLIGDIMAKLEELGGYVESSETNGSAADSTSRYANMILRIPSDKMQQMLSMVKEKSNVIYDNVNSEDVTLRYVDMESHIEALRTEQKALLRLMEQADKIEDVIALQSQLTQVRYEIESYESRLREMDNLVEYSTMYLDITEVERTTTASDRKQTFGQEIKSRFSDNLYAVGQWLRSFVIWLVSSLPILVPLVLVFVLAVRLLCRWRKHRKEQRPVRNTTGADGYRSIYAAKHSRKQKGEEEQKEEKVQEQADDK